MKQDRLDIGVILSSAGLMRGGLETAAVAFSRELAQSGHSVHLMAGYWPGRQNTVRDLTNEVAVSRSPCLPADHRIWRILGMLSMPGLSLKVQSLSFVYGCRFWPSARRRLLAFDVTLTFLEIETVRISIWRRQNGRPNVSYFPGMMDSNWLRRDESASRLAISQSLADEYTHYTWLEFDGVVRPGIDRHWLEAPYQVRPQGRFIAFVGRLEENKGLRLLLELFHRLILKKPGLRLTLVGDGPLRGWIMEQKERLDLGDQLHCPGSLPAEEVRRVLESADLFVFPSCYESFGIAVLEAMAVGVPVVCSDLPALREVASEAAIYIDADHLLGWVAAVESLLDNKAERKWRSQEGKKRAAVYTWSRSAAELEKNLWKTVGQGA